MASTNLSLRNRLNVLDNATTQSVGAIVTIISFYKRCVLFLAVNFDLVALEDRLIFGRFFL